MGKNEDPKAADEPDTEGDDASTSTDAGTTTSGTVQQQTTTTTQQKLVNFEVRGRPDDPGPVKEYWFVSLWRPAMAWLYMLLVFSDFIFMPIFTMVFPTLPFVKGIVYTAWHPLTLEGSGLIHVTFMTVLGITAWGRTKEKTSDTSEASGG